MDDKQLRQAVADIPEYLEFTFDRTTRLRGIEYAREGRVSNIKIKVAEKGIVVTGVVHGTGKSPYLTEISFPLDAPDEIIGTCTCPLGSFCKHAVALAESVAQAARHGGHDKKALSSRDKISPAGKELIEKPLTSSQKMWLQSISSTSIKTPVVFEKPNLRVLPNSIPKLRYSVSGPIKNNFTRLEVLCVWTQRVGQEISRIDDAVEELLTSNKIELDELDNRALRAILLKRLNFGGLYGHNTSEISCNFEAEDEEIFESLLDAGRLVHQQYPHMPLVRHPGFTGTPVWEETSSKSLVTRIHVDDLLTKPLFLPLKNLWCVDLANHTVGQLSSNVPEVILSEWLKAPSVRKDQYKALGLALTSARVAREIFPRVPLGIEEVKEGVPIPVLHLFRTQFHAPITINSNKGTSYETVLVPAGDLRFEYAGEVIAANSPEKTLAVRGTKGTDVYVRNSQLETNYLHALKSCGLRTSSGLLELDPPGYLGSEILERWNQFVNEKIPDLKNAGWKISFSDDFFPLVDHSDDWYADLNDEENSWFSGDLGIVVDNERISMIPILRNLLRSSPTLSSTSDVLHVRINSKLIALKRERVELLLNSLADLLGDSDKVLKLKRVQALSFGHEIALSGIRIDTPESISMLKKRLLTNAVQVKAPVPSGLKAELREYQVLGYSWMRYLADLGLGGILADDMGLGKTIQSLALIQYLREKEGALKKPVLIVCPKSLIPNWKAEAERFVPSLPVLRYHGLGRDADTLTQSGDALILTTYALVHRDREAFSKAHFLLVIFDEGQWIKNSQTQSYEAAASLKADLKFVCSGTPIENNVRDLWALLTLPVPGLLSDLATFRRVYEKGSEQGFTDRKAALARRVKPFVLRRTKEQVLPDLPVVTEVVQRVKLDGKQRDLYETVRALMDSKIKKAVAEKGLKRSHIEFLDALLKLRQVCCDPRLLKLKAAANVKESAKLEALMDILRTLASENRKVLIFSQFVTMLDLIENELTENGYAYDVLTGQTVDREKPIKRFQNGEVPILLVSLKAGGVGLNLTAADTVVLYDPWWNPAVEEQAIGRAHRIGQKNPVFVYRFVAEGTVEEKILILQQKKKDLIDGVLGSDGEPNLGGLGNAIVEELLAPIGS